MNGFAIVRYLPNGDLDATFGEGGKVVIDMGNSISGVSVKVRNDNGMIVCGRSATKTIVIAHIRPNGELDLDIFGSEAKYSSSYMDGQERPIIRKVMFAQPDQLVLAAGTKSNRNSKRRVSLLNEILIFLAQFGKLLVSALNVLHIIPRPPMFPGLRVLAVGDVGGLVSPRLIAVAGYNTHADLDQSFANNGEIIQPAGSEKIEVGAADYDSRAAKSIVITHKHDHDLPVLRVARFFNDGTLDNYVSYASWLTENNTGPPWEIEPRDVVFRKNITIVGRAFQKSVGRALVVVRIKNDGSVDRNFGEMDGVGFIPENDFRSAFNSVEFDARSRIIVAGNASDRFCLARFSPNGKFDASFNENNIAIADFDGDRSRAEVVSIDSVRNERIVVAGEAGGQFALARYLDKGSLDPTFGTNGKVRTTLLSEHVSVITDIAFDNQQRIIASGSVNREIIID